MLALCNVGFPEERQRVIHPGQLRCLVNLLLGCFLGLLDDDLPDILYECLVCVRGSS